MYSALSTLNTMTEVHLSVNACPLLWVCVNAVCVCVFTAGCVHFGWVNDSEYGSPYLTVYHVT